ncbi:hypothetical protein MKX01_022187 [Papaver californicum]|nr:hypothetical protein MKX01_022187 [Papaver californicum]
MDVIFETSIGKVFTIEVGYFDTVLEMKEKIHKYEGIPISRQTLILNGQIMSDKHDTEFYQVLHGSRLHLQIDASPHQHYQQPMLPVTSPKIKIEDSSSSMSSSTSRIQLLIRILVSNKQFSLDFDVNDTVGKLRDKIHEIQKGIPCSRLALFLSNNELIDDKRTLNDYGIVDLSQIRVTLKSVPPTSMPTTTTLSGGKPTTTTMSGGRGGGCSMSSGSSPDCNKRLKLMVLPKCGTQKVQVEVNGNDKVRELKKELQKLNQRGVQFNLPSDGYFFIYNQNVMDEDRSFKSHELKQGDTIEIFNGSITGGS